MIIHMRTDLIVCVLAVSLGVGLGVGGGGEVLSNSVSSTVRHVRVEPGETPAIPPAVGPHHCSIRQQCLSPELTSWATGELEESVWPLVSLDVVSRGVDQTLGNTGDKTEGDDPADCAGPE